MEKINIEGYRFIKYSKGNAEIVFSSAIGNLNFNKATEDGKNNLESLKKWFDVDKVIYLNQIHSDIIYEYKDNYDKNIDNHIFDGDAIITKEKNIAIGVFTADCVPVIMVDVENEVIAAVHSGWKGTFSCIVAKTIERMKSEYNTNINNVHVYIGPHNKVCCYEVGEELSSKFMSQDMYNGIDIVKNINLDLEKCVITQLEISGVPLENIQSTKLCTYCNTEFEMYSYRKEEQKHGRMFSFVCLTTAPKVMI